MYNKNSKIKINLRTYMNPCKGVGADNLGRQMEE